MNEQAKWSFLEHAPAGDARHPIIRQIAVSFWTAVQCSAPQSITIARRRFADLAFTVARDWVRFETDTDRLGHEDIAGFTRDARADDAVDALRRGVDDCDAKARLFVALCIAGGVQAHMVPHWQAGQLAHVSAAFSEDGATWVPVELTLSRARAGDTARTIPRETETGKWQTT
jgi:transglutaminase-like putative cysteine protease